MKPEEVHPFISHLRQLHSRDRGAIAQLRHSLAFAPGNYPKAYPHVERFVGRDKHAEDPRRLAHYAVAGLFAMHPLHHGRSLAAALGQLFVDEKRPSLELRFIALLEADADGLMAHLRQAVSLLLAQKLGFDHAALLDDLCVVLDDKAWPERRDRVRRKWARDFYRAQQRSEDDAPADASQTAT